MILVGKIAWFKNISVKIQFIIEIFLKVVLLKQVSDRQEGMVKIVNI